MGFNLPLPPSGNRPGNSSSPPAAGGSGSGSGSGKSGTPTATPGPGSGGAKMIGSDMIDVSRLTPDRSEYGPPIFVNPDDQVFVVPRRSNTAHCFVSTGGSNDAKFPPRLELTNTDNPVQVSVQSLRQIGVYSTVVGEGVTIVLQRRP